MKICNNCAWYCHRNGKCYGNLLLTDGIEIGLPINEAHAACENWSFDGLQDWERDACKREDTLVTMELEMA